MSAACHLYMSLGVGGLLCVCLASIYNNARTEGLEGTVLEMYSSNMPSYENNS